MATKEERTAQAYLYLLELKQFPERTAVINAICPASQDREALNRARCAMRARHLLFNNRPGGDKSLPHGGKHTEPGGAFNIAGEAHDLSPALVRDIYRQLYGPGGVVVYPSIDIDIPSDWREILPE